MLNIANFNIMSPSSAKYYFTNDNISLDNNKTILDTIVNINEYQFRLPYVFDFIYTYLYNNSYNVESLDILSLEEVNFDAKYFRQNIGSFQCLDKQVHKPFIKNSKSWELNGDYMITYINTNNIKIIKDYTEEYQIYYNSKDGGNFISLSGFEYPSRTQIFLLQKYDYIFLYVHVHGPGLPNDNIKLSFFNCLNKYLQLINNDYPIIIIGDMNENRANKLLSWLPDIKLSSYEDELNRYTSYHRIINLGYPFNMNYLKSDAISLRYSYISDENNYNLIESDENIYKKVDQLLYTSDKLSVDLLLTVPNDGMLNYAPYKITNFTERSIIKPNIILDKKYIPKKLINLDFLSSWNLNLSSENWISDHSLMIYTLNFK